jgi:hypothetical protein
VGKVQQALDLSLTQLADLQDGSATILHPLFGPAEPPRPGAQGLDIFVLMPFTAELKAVFDDHIRKTAMQLNLTIQKADDMPGSRDIMHDIWQNICNSRLVIADCTGSICGQFDIYPMSTRREEWRLSNLPLLPQSRA